MTVISIGLHLDCCCSVAQSCPTLCDSMDRSILGLRGPHHLPEFAQVHVHCISDAVQPSHPLTPSSPSQFSPSSETFPMITYLDQFSSVAQSCPIVCDPVDCSPPGLPVHHQLLELIQTHVHWASDAIQPRHPLLLLPSILLSIRVFSNESALRIRWPKCWSFSFSISPSHEYSGLISFKIDWLDLLAAQGILKSLLQHHSSKAPILCIT